MGSLVMNAETYFPSGRLDVDSASSTSECALHAQKEAPLCDLLLGFLGPYTISKSFAELFLNEFILYLS